MVRVVIRPWPLSVAVWAIGTWPQGSVSRASNKARRFSFTGSTNSPPCSWMWFAVAFTVCSASAVTILPFQVDLAEYHRGHRHLVRLLADLGLRGDHRGGGVRADQGREQPDLVPVWRPSRPGSPCRPA